MQARSTTTRQVNDAVAGFASNEDGLCLRQRIMRFLRSRGLESLHEVHVDVDRGIVFLRGTIPTSHDRWLCDTCARRVAGVIRLVDELQVEEHADSRPRPN